MRLLAWWHKPASAARGGELSQPIQPLRIRAGFSVGEETQIHQRIVQLIDGGRIGPNLRFKSRDSLCIKLPQI